MDSPESIFKHKCFCRTLLIEHENFMNFFLYHSTWHSDYFFPFFSYPRLTFARYKKFSIQFSLHFFVCVADYEKKKSKEPIYLMQLYWNEWGHNKIWLKFDEIRDERRWKLNFNKGANCWLYLYVFGAAIPLFMDILLSWFKVAQVEIDNEVDEHYRKHEMAIQ